MEKDIERLESEIKKLDEISINYDNIVNCVKTLKSLLRYFPNDEGKTEIEYLNEISRHAKSRRNQTLKKISSLNEQRKEMTSKCDRKLPLR